MSRPIAILTALRTAAAQLGEAAGELFPSVIQSELDAARDEGWAIDEAAAYCGRCGSSVGPGEATRRGCSRCVNERIAWDRIVRLGAYKPPLERWIVHMKFHRAWQWAGWIGRELAMRLADEASDREVTSEAEREDRSTSNASNDADAAPSLNSEQQATATDTTNAAPSNSTTATTEPPAAAPSNSPPAARHADVRTAVCPVPMPRLRQWWRGFNQSHLIASAIAQRGKLPFAALLRRRGWQAPQTTLVASQRDANVRHCFELTDVDLTGCHIVLVDDVKTTGATLGACARLLRRAGASRITCAVAAVADPKHADFKVK